MKSISVDEIMKQTPCEDWPRERFIEEMHDPQAITIHDITKTDAPIADKFWLLLRKPFMSDAQVSDFLWACLEHAYKNINEEINSYSRDALWMASQAANGHITKEHCLHDDEAVRARMDAMPEITKRAMFTATWCCIAMKPYDLVNQEREWQYHLALAIQGGK